MGFTEGAGVGADEVAEVGAVDENEVVIDVAFVNGVGTADGDSVAAAGGKGITVGSAEDEFDGVASEELCIVGCVVGSPIIIGLAEGLSTSNGDGIVDINADGASVGNSNDCAGVIIGLAEECVTIVIGGAFVGPRLEESERACVGLADTDDCAVVGLFVFGLRVG